MEIPPSELRKPLRPMDQTSLWTFTAALALLRKVPDDHISDALDEFLLHSSALLASAYPFAQQSKKDFAESTREFTLRGVLYSDVTPENVKMARRIADLCETDLSETLRVIVQTKARVPEFDPPKTGLSLRLPDDAAAVAENRRMYRYTSALLRERRTVVALAAECFLDRFDDRYLATVRNVGKTLAVDSKYVLLVIATVGTTMASLGDQELDELAQLVFSEKVLFVVELLKLLCEVFVAPSHRDSAVVDAWFLLMHKCNFGAQLGPKVPHREAYTLLQALITVFSLQVLHLHYDFASPDALLYLEDGRIFSVVNAAITECDPTAIVRYAWLLLVYKKSLVLREIPHSQSKFLAVVDVHQTSSAMAFLQRSVESAHVFTEIEALSAFLKFDDVFGVVLVDLVVLALPVVSMTPAISACISKVLLAAPNSAIERFFDSPDVLNAIVLARAKFPMVLAPYLNLAAVNGNFALHELTEIRLYIAVFDKASFSAKYDIDLDNTELVRITEPIDLFPPYETSNKLSMLVKPGTKAKIIPTADETKILVCFIHTVNGWAFVGRVLQNISRTFDIKDDDKMQTLFDLVDLLASASAEGSPDDLATVLEYMSAYTDDSDVVEVLFRLFEQGLHSRSTELLQKLLLVFSSLMPVISTRVWPYLTTSSLLSHRGKEGFVSILFGSIEMVRGDYTFTTELVKFVFALSENCLSVHDDYHVDSKSELLTRFIEHLLLVFETYNTCKFNDGFQKLELGLLILDVFRQTLETIHCIDSGVAADKKPTRVFARASDRILDAFLFTDSTTTRSATSILSMIESLSSTANYYEVRDMSGYFANLWINSALSFSRLIITIRLSIKAAPCLFEREIFSRLPQLVTVYSRGGPLRKPVLDLITALTSGTWDKEPMPSMLSHLGRDYSRVFLHSLAVDLDNSFDDYAIKISIYDLLCSIMEANQQGLSVLFISGRDVFGEFAEQEKGETSKALSLLSILKKNVNDIKYYPQTVTVHLLDAIALAFNSWTTTKDSDSDVTFVKELVRKLENFTKVSTESGTYELIISSYQCKLYAKVAEILSLVLFSTKNEKCREPIIKLLTKEEFLKKLPLFFTIVNYETSLYEEVNAQFESAFPGNKLSQFSVAIQKRNRYGVGAVYDLLLMDPLFQKNPQLEEIRQMIIRSSANIQFFNAQIALSKSVGALVATFCRKATASLVPEFFELAAKLLTISEPVDAYSKAFTSQQYLERIEISFLIAFTINGIDSCKKSPSTALNIIESCGGLISSHVITLPETQPLKEFTCKSLLRLIYVALSILKEDYELVISRFSVLRDLFDTVIAKGTKNIIIGLQNDIYLSRTDKKHVSTNFADRLDDLKLIFTILKSYLALTISPTFQQELAACLAENGTVETLLSLYSFSHLILVNDEPIFAQLSLMFLQQLLSVDSFADKFFNAGLFVVIRESMISVPLRKGGVTVENAAQIHRNWTNGILPILVATLARTSNHKEVFLTLRAFSKQIESCVESWSRDSSSLQLSSSATWETTQIMFIYRFLSAMAKAEEFVVANPTDVDMPLLPGLDTQQKRDDFVDYINNLLKHPKFLSSRIVASTPEEAATLEAGDVASQELVKGIIEDIGELKKFLS